MLQQESIQGTNKKEQEGERQENQEEPIHEEAATRGALWKVG